MVTFSETLTGEKIVYTDQWMLWARWARPLGVTAGHVEVHVTLAAVDDDLLEGQVGFDNLQDLGWAPTYRGLTWITELPDDPDLTAAVDDLVATLLRDHLGENARPRAGFRGEFSQWTGDWRGHRRPTTG